MATRKNARKPAASTKRKPAAGKASSTARAPKRKKTSVKGISPQKRQRIALILFVVAVFLICLILIPGESIWFALHAFILGLFGHSSILWPILLIYIAVTISLEKSLRSIQSKLWLCTALICAVTATFFLFTYVESTQNFWGHLGQLYTAGYTNRGSGLLSGLIGIPLIRAFGLLGAKIFSILLDFLLLMLFTGTGLAQLIRILSAPAKAVGKTASDLMDGNDEASQNSVPAAAPARSRRSAIDIPLDADEEAALNQNSGPAALPRNEKFTQLREAVRTNEPGKFKPDLTNYEQNEPEAASVLTPDAMQEKTIAEIPLIPDAPVAESESEPVLPIQPMPDETGVQEEQPGDLTDVLHAIEMLENPTSVKEQQAADKAQQNAASAPSQASGKAPEIDPNQSVMIPEPTDGMENHYRFPPITLLDEDKPQNNRADSNAALQATGERLIATLKSFGVAASILNICKGPAVTRYELQPAAGVKISRITNLADDIALNLAAAGVRIEAPIPNKAAIGIEVPNRQTSIVKLRGLVDSTAFAQAKSRLTVALGRDITGNITLADLAKMPHLLIAGSTGSGKSVCINTMIVSLLYKSTPDEVRLLMVDPKVVELGVYNGIPHLLVPVVTDPRKAAGALNWAVGEMLARYKTFAATGVRDLPSYNHFVEQKNAEDPTADLKPLPQIVIVVDELADLMMAAPNEVEDAICRLAQMARAAGMHLVIATQRPSVDVITGVIKANIPSRIAFAVSSQIDSRTILDTGGAEKLLGRGDMLFAPIGSNKPTRVQGCFVSDDEIEQIVDFIKKSAECAYDADVADEIERRAVVNKKAHDSEDEDENDGDTDPMLEEAVKCVSEAGQASTSLLQRKLRLGYARAGRLIDEMEIRGIVGPHEGSKPRQVLVSYAQWSERNRMKNAAAPQEEE